MISDPFNIMGNALTFLEHKYTNKQLKKIIFKLDFKRVSGRTKGEEDINSFFRK